MRGRVVMSNEEKKLYDILFPYDNDPDHVNYAYYTGGSKRSLLMLKSKIEDSYIVPVLVEDEKDDGSFFIRILQKDVDIFLDMIKSSKYNEKKIPKRYIGDVRALFGDN
jgi:hypothetical protein